MKQMSLIYKARFPSNRMRTVLVVYIAFGRPVGLFVQPTHYFQLGLRVVSRDPPGYFDLKVSGGKHVLFCVKLDGLSEKHNASSPQH